MENKTIELLGYQEFLSMMKTLVKETIGSQYNVEINHVIKNNSIELDGLIILKEHERITPNIYLNAYYENYLKGNCIKEMVDEIVGIYRNTLEESERDTLHFQYDFKELKKSVMFRLVNYDKNKKLLQDVPHVRILDLALTFHCLVKSSDKGIGTIRITNSQIENWNTDMNELKELARMNTPILFPSTIRNMNDVILDILKNDIVSNTRQDFTSEQCLDNNDLSVNDILDGVLEGMDHKNTDMYILTNTKGINGASCLLYPNVLKKLADQLCADFYILPSSIHEIILVRDDGQLNKNLLKEMVIDVNCTQVPEEEILSNNVYFYSRERDAISM